jgi:hypothetical protein
MLSGIAPGARSPSNFHHPKDANALLGHERCGSSPLSLHPDKTRRIEFGPHAARNREKRGLGKPETFKFLGFVLICGKSRRGDFQIRRNSRRACARSCGRIKEGLRQRWHLPIPDTGKWLGQIVAGYFAYHAVPTNSTALGAFRYHVTVSGTGVFPGAVRRRVCGGRGWRSWPMIFSLGRGSFIPGQMCASPSDPRGRGRVPELGSLGSVRGAFSSECPYRETVQEYPQSQGADASQFSVKSSPTAPTRLRLLRSGVLHRIIAKSRAPSEKCQSRDVVARIGCGCRPGLDRRRLEPSKQPETPAAPSGGNRPGNVGRHGVAGPGFHRDEQRDARDFSRLSGCR